MVTFTQIFVVVLPISSYRKQVRFSNALGMWSADSSGKEFLWKLTRHKNEEGRSERSENIPANQDVALSDLWCPNECFESDNGNMCHFNEYFPFGADWVVTFLAPSLRSVASITWPAVLFPGVGCGKEEKWKLSQNLTTALRERRCPVFEPNHFKQKLSMDHLLPICDIMCHRSEKNKTKQNETHKMRWDFFKAWNRSGLGCPLTKPTRDEQRFLDPKVFLRVW